MFERSMRQFNTISAYLTPSPFRIKADRIFSCLNFTVIGNTVSWLYMYVITFYKLYVCLISPFEARACSDYIFYLIDIDNYLREYTESTINIIRVLKVICVNNLSKISYIF